MRLALRTGQPVRVVQQQWTYADFEQYLVYEAYEPTGELRDDHRVAKAVCDMVEFLRDRKSGSAPKPEQFLLKFEEPEEVGSDEWLQRKREKVAMTMKAWSVGVRMMTGKE